MAMIGSAVWTKKKFSFLAFCVLLSAGALPLKPCFGQSQSQSQSQNKSQNQSKKVGAEVKPTKDLFWLLELSGNSPLGDSPLGTSASIHVGMGSFFSRGFYELGLDILSGPYQSSSGDDLGTDYNGTGISGQLGWHIGPGTFRRQPISVGILLGLEYSDVTGTSFSRNSEGQITRENLRVIRYLALPGLYLGYWQTPRIDGNAVELLDTRIEGAILSLSLSLPLSNDWQGQVPSTTTSQKNDGQSSAAEDPLDRAFIKVGLQVFLGV